MSNISQKFKSVAFRLEGLPDYPGEYGPSESMIHFEQFGVTPDGHNDDWAELVAQARRRGARVKRLRLVHKPLTRYERYEVMAGYNKGVAAGEEIRIYPVGSLDRKDPDFWVFDNQVIRKMQYDEAGRMQGFKEVGVGSAERSMTDFWMDIFEQSIPLSDFREQPLHQTDARVDSDTR